MSQAPRKFSDKIAMLMNKQNEEEEQFNRVMKDVRPITASTPGKSPNSTPSSTPYTCSPTGNNPNFLPNTESPDYLQLHPLSMAWQRQGGSLPNVHAMLQPNVNPNLPQPPPDMYGNWAYWQQQPSTAQPTGYGHVRTRSPGAQHYHPYRANAKSNERVPPLENHLVNSGQMHLQPPDPNWSNSRARSDPAIHMNTMNSMPFYNQPAPQWKPEMNGYVANGQQNGSPMQSPQNPLLNQMAPQSYYAPGSTGSINMSMSPPAYPMHSSPQQSCTPDQVPCGSLPNMHSPMMTSPMSSPMGMCQSPVQSPQGMNQHPMQGMGTSAQMQNQMQGQNSMQGQNQMQNQGQMAGQNQHMQMNQNQPQSQHYQGQNPQNHMQNQNPNHQMSQNSNLHQNPPQINQNQPAQNGHVNSQMNPQITKLNMNNTNHVHPQHQKVQQQQKPLQQQFSYDQVQHNMMNYPYAMQNGQLATPQGQGVESSQSAPTSPAQSLENPMQPHWPPTRHFSASPDTMDIPNIVLTGADGTLDCFQVNLKLILL
ncbi:unnamed protein product [Bursaphelenchus okinawaensis]|uniref:Transducer of regulated CREB activity N-terminal domain-containing protein n=1 Tax=Bursaphelenchus okinawaensis TaxID=465554 RepID=A0A811JVT0_9BILA|nr:unnamed protein product [Bursaphelenchus okinawaensis]CAG9084875.1 unnamed protein product [Bursaphelenchus okinawaensis]